ncbi:MAG: HepT-like ribonuclease domain-containing protein, partial [Terriglobales bacterium]
MWDIQEGADGIVRFTTSLDFSGYVENEMVRAAVERKFEIIGEALNQLAKRDAAVPRRNLLIHGYAIVNHA